MSKYDQYPSAADSTIKSTLFFHRLVETYKYAFAQRAHLEDSDDPKVLEVIKKLQNEDFVTKVHELISDETTYASKSGHYDKDPVIYNTLFVISLCDN